MFSMYGLTLISLILYAVYAYWMEMNFCSSHAIYIITLIIYNSNKLQSDNQFKHLHPALLQKEQNNSHLQVSKQKKFINICKICCRLKPPRYYHCRRCNICIYKMDHHCQWLGCCVGQYNLKIYFHLIINLFILGLGCLIQIIVSKQSWFSLVKILLFIFCGVVIWQTCRMLKNFWEMVKNDQTLIQSYKNVAGKRYGYSNLCQIFGEKFRFNWLLPVYANIDKCNIWQQVYPVQSQNSQIQEYTYADQYMYGSDDLDMDQVNQIPDKQQNKEVKQKIAEKQTKQGKNKKIQ